MLVAHAPARSPITGATVCAQILIIPRPDTCHVTGVHACAPIYTHARARAFNGQQYFATARCRRDSLSLSLVAEDRVRVSTLVRDSRVSVRVYARGHSRPGTRPASPPCGHFPPTPPSPRLPLCRGGRRDGIAMRSNANERLSTDYDDRANLLRRLNALVHAT